LKTRFFSLKGLLKRIKAVRAEEFGMKAIYFICSKERVKKEWTLTNKFCLAKIILELKTQNRKEWK
jgi:hypothetical protein